MSKNGKFQINSSHHFLTYPQFPGVSKEFIFDTLVARCAPYRILVAKESHQDGGDHYHCYLAYAKAKYVSDPSFYDIDGHHGNYQGCRSVNRVLEYCTKESDVVASFDWKKKLEAKKGFKKIVGKQLMEGASLDDVMAENPQLLFGYTKLKADLEQWQADMKKYEPFPPYLPNPWGKIIWFERKCKKRHYWIFSREPNFGKTYHFARPLREEYGAVIQTGDFAYWNVLSSTRCVILDEYNTAKLKWDQLNSLADGNFGFRVFQGGVRTLKNPLIIILSNQSISDLYPHMNQFILARFNEIELK